MFREDLKNYLRAGQPGVWIVTSDEDRTLREISSIAGELGDGYVRAAWSCTSGFIVDGQEPEDADVFTFLEKVASLEEGHIVIAKDFHLQDSANDPQINRATKDALIKCRAKGNHFIILSPITKLPTEWEKLVVVMDHPLPDRSELKDELVHFLATTVCKPSDALKAAEELGWTDIKVIGGDENLDERSNWKFEAYTKAELDNPSHYATFNVSDTEGIVAENTDDERRLQPQLFAKMAEQHLTEEEMRAVADAAAGLTPEEFVTFMALSQIKKGAILTKEIMDRKAEAFRKNQMAEIVANDIDMDQVGGLDLLKDWLGERVKAFGQSARDYGLPQPKGIMLLGVQGCGKSLSAKAIAQLYDLPLIRMDFGRLFSAFLGQTEERTRIAIGLAEAVAPCVLWIDHRST